MALLGSSAWNVSPNDFVFRLKELKLFPARFRSIAAAAKAATLRASVRNAGDWKASLMELVDERGREDATLGDPFIKWYASSSIAHLKGCNREYSQERLKLLVRSKTKK